MLRQHILTSSIGFIGNKILLKSDKTKGLYSLSFHNTYLRVKRGFDLFFVILFLPIILCIVVITAIAIKISSKGSVFFTQKRVGRRNIAFTLYKFRSVVMNVNDSAVTHLEIDSQQLTKTGRLIRKYRIDELPQFWNVLKGDMSVIGPRPEQVPLVEKFNEEIPVYAARHVLRPGITGWAQVKTGDGFDLESTKIKLQYDLYYIKHLSFTLDLLIIFKTINKVLTGFDDDET